MKFKSRKPEETPKTAPAVEETEPADLQVRFEELTVETGRLRSGLQEAQFVPHRKRLPDTRQSMTHKFSIKRNDNRDVSTSVVRDDSRVGRCRTIGTLIATEAQLDLGRRSNLVAREVALSWHCNCSAVRRFARPARSFADP